MTSQNITKNCVLLFSGGRDSSLAALKLAKLNYNLILLTITSKHLTGLLNVEQRINELRNLLPDTTRWILADQPNDLLTDTNGYARTCLPCHHAYIATGAKIALDFECKNLATGYAGYQSSWPEQTSEAISIACSLLGSVGISFIYPVYNLDRSNEVNTALSMAGIPPYSSEQKCSLHQSNVILRGDGLSNELNLWKSLMQETFNNIANLKISIIRDVKIDTMDRVFANG